MTTKVKLNKTAEQMDTLALECRSENHRWTRVYQSNSSKALAGRYTVVTKGVLKQLEVLRVCITCDSERTDVYSIPSFNLEKRIYRYSEIFKGGKHSRLNRSEYRAAYLVREMKELFN